MASEEKRSGRNSLNKQRIINPITSTLAADDAVRPSRKTIGKMVEQYQAEPRRPNPPAVYTYPPPEKQNENGKKPYHFYKRCR